MAEYKAPFQIAFCEGEETVLKEVVVDSNKKVVSPKFIVTALNKLMDGEAPPKDLNITWVDGRADWGRFVLLVTDSKNVEGEFYWEICGVDCNCSEFAKGQANTKDLAIEACEKALKRIITGGKE